MKNEQKEFIKAVSDWFFNRGISSRGVADFIGCQVALESDYGTSNLALKKSNYTGMKMPLRRINVAVGFNTFASYTSLSLCLFDYTLWMAWNNFEQNTLFDLDAFVTKLEACGYCPEPDYITKITNLLNSYKNE